MLDETPAEAIVRLEKFITELQVRPGINMDRIVAAKRDLAFYESHSQK